ncbi:MAG: hypothetical protein AB7O68_16975 [Pirellulales bacterium]
MNYTTGIAAEKTIGEIQKNLAAHGAQAILAEYDDSGNIVMIKFKIPVNGQSIGYQLPSDWRPVLKVMESHPKVPRRLCTQDQALRVSWRIIKDWVAAQMALVETQMAPLDEVFLPYAITPSGRTLYDHVQETHLLSAPQ